MSGMNGMNGKTIGAIAVTLLFWSSAYAGIRAGLDGGLSAGHLVLLRFISASAVFAVYALFKRIRLPRGRDWIRVALLGFTGISVYHISLTFGELTVPAGTASLLIASAPAFTAIIASFVLHERMTALGWVGTGLGFVGVAVITATSGGSPGFTQGALLILLAAVMTSLFFVFQKPVYRRYRAIDLTAWFTWFGTLPMLYFLPGLWPQVAQVPAAATLSVVYIGVFPAAVAYVAWAIALSRAPTGIVSSVLYLNPVLAIFIAWMWLGELPHVFSIVGGTIAICGVIIVNLWGAEKLHPSVPSSLPEEAQA